MRDASVADMLAWETWTRQQQEIARAALYNELQATEEDVRMEEREVIDEERAYIAELVAALRALTTGINEAMAEARDVTKPRTTREARWATVQSGLVAWDAKLKELEKAL